MEWLKIVSQHLPTILLVLTAAFFLGAEIIKTAKTWKEKTDSIIQNKVNAQQKELEEKEELKDIHNKLEEISAHFKTIDKKIQDSDTKIEMLIESDRDDIKAWIVDKYHKFYIKQKYIDAFSMEAIEKRYCDYCREDGNGFVKDLVEKLRSLPMDPDAVNKGD